MQPYNAKTDTPGSHTPPEVQARRVNGRTLAILSLLVYFAGFCVLAVLLIANRLHVYTGLSAALLFAVVTLGSLAVSIVLAIAASFTYPRALLMAIIHIPTIWLLILASQKI
jgi:hypothetical protein